MRSFYRKIDSLKLNSDKTTVLILRLLYRLFSSRIFLGTINVAIPFFFSLQIIKDNSTFNLWGIICLFVLVVINIICGIAGGYKTHNLNSIHALNTIVNNINMLNKIYNERITNENGFQGLFELMSDSICISLYQLFQVTFKIETRISIIQQYPDNKNGFLCMMISRTSHNTQRLGHRRKASRVKYTQGKDKYYKRILIDNTDKPVILSRDEIEKIFIFRNRKDIQQYIALPQKAYGKKIAFILQIDVMQKNGFGESPKDIEKFCEEYVDPFIRILQNAYLVETIRGGNNQKSYQLIQ